MQVDGEQSGQCHERERCRRATYLIHEEGQLGIHGIGSRQDQLPDQGCSTLKCPTTMESGRLSAAGKINRLIRSRRVHLQSGTNPGTGQEPPHGSQPRVVHHQLQHRYRCNPDTGPPTSRARYRTHSGEGQLQHRKAFRNRRWAPHTSTANMENESTFISLANRGTGLTRIRQLQLG